MNQLFNLDFLEYLLLLNKYEVEYVLVGGMAININDQLLRGIHGDASQGGLFTPVKLNTQAEPGHRPFGVLTDHIKVRSWKLLTTPLKIDKPLN